jgi:hypothetical protein
LRACRWLPLVRRHREPGLPFATRFIGDYSGIATTLDHVAAYWTDMRETACLNRCGAAENTYFASVP